MKTTMQPCSHETLVTTTTCLALALVQPRALWCPDISLRLSEHVLNIAECSSRDHDHDGLTTKMQQYIQTEVSTSASHSAARRPPAGLEPGMFSTLGSRKLRWKSRRTTQVYQWHVVYYSSQYTKPAAEILRGVLKTSDCIKRWRERSRDLCRRFKSCVQVGAREHQQ